MHMYTVHIHAHNATYVYNTIQTYYTYTYTCTYVYVHIYVLISGGLACNMPLMQCGPVLPKLLGTPVSVSADASQILCGLPAAYKRVRWRGRGSSRRPTTSKHNKKKQQEGRPAYWNVTNLCGKPHYRVSAYYSMY